MKTVASSARQATRRFVEPNNDAPQCLNKHHGHRNDESGARSEKSDPLMFVTSGRRMRIHGDVSSKKASELSKNGLFDEQCSHADLSR